MPIKMSRSIQSEITKIIRTYLKKYENAIIDGSTDYLVEAASDGWDAVILQQSTYNVHEAITAAIKNNHLSTMQILYNLHNDISQQDQNDWGELAAALGHTEIVFAINDWNLDHSLYIAAGAGQLETVTSLLARIPANEYAILNACLGGHLAVAKKLIGSNVAFLKNSLIQSAIIENGLIEFVNFKPPIFDHGRVSRHPRMVNYLLRKKQLNPNDMLVELACYDYGGQDICIDRLKSIALCIAYGGIEFNDRALGQDANVGSMYDFLSLRVMQCLFED